MEISRQQWNNFVSKTPGGGFLQSFEWGEMQGKLSVPYWRLVERAGDNIVSVALVLKRVLPAGQAWLYVPRGPVVSETSKYSEASEASTLPASLASQLVSLAQEQNAVFVRAEPVDIPPKEWTKADHDVQPRHTLVLDLEQSEEELLAAMHQKTRYNIRLAEKKGVQIRFSREQKDLDHFLELSRDVGGRSAFQYHPDEYYRAMLSLSELSETSETSKSSSVPRMQVELGVAEHEDDVLAVHILISFGDTVTYAHGASGSHKRNLMAPHLLQWESIRQAKQQGYKHFDFFGVAPSASETSKTSKSSEASSHPWAGITRFKEGFGGRRVSYPGAYDYVLNMPWYWTYNTSKKLRSLLR